MKAIPLAAKPYQSAFYSIGIEECHNLYLEVSAGEGSKVNQYLVGIPGLKLKSVETSNSRDTRGLYTTGSSRTFQVAGQMVYEISYMGVKTQIGVLDTFSGPVGMANNKNQLIIVDGKWGYIYNLNDNTFNRITSTDFPNGATHVGYIDGYFIVNVPNSQSIQWSSAQDGTEWNSLDYAEADSNCDLVNGLTICNNMAFVFGRNTLEMFYDSGDYKQQFQRYQGGIIQVGTYSPYSIASIDGSVFWVGSDSQGANCVWMTQGLQAQKVSTRGIEQRLQFAQTPSDFVGYTYSQNGHVNYCISSQSGDFTYVYDKTVDAWHQRTFLDQYTGLEHRWRGYYHTYNFGQNIFGDYASDCLYYLDMGHFVNDNPNGIGWNPIRRLKTSPIFYKDNKRLIFRELQLQFQQGIGLQYGISDSVGGPVGDKPVVMVEWSDDSGNTWSNQLTCEIGSVGEYAYRSRLFNTGSARNRVYRFSITDPVGPIVMVQLWANIAEGYR